ncbi:protein of unknown function [Mariniphaga anaerophila]|uniref:DUF4625 domain-containing protein n=1 Tax=Mariniphaga anaerophila TaxID=1484053 RepID=A0A1M5FDU5_9BACT|nr:DUF4625 domain-containing protein [Mariniphaga anaerophila]SHF89619.1 protein of unknown function [Mariniphaga anaerophila]
MKSVKIILVASLLLLVFNFCTQDAEIDKQEPQIDLTIEGAFPQNCDTLYFGESFKLKMLFSDNVELGSFSIDVHHNFDHHSHSTEVSQCDFLPEKDPVNPFSLIDDYKIENGLQKYETDELITIPSGNENGPFDDGDYHFFVRLTDKEGWSVRKGLSIKIFHR